jgi:NADPH:quinone reductase-like Zn-dependent oxidoreductase
MALAIRFSEYGTSEVLQLTDVPPLTAGPGQVRLAVRAAGVNPLDWKILQGLFREHIPLQLPAGLGSDVAGVVDQVGDGVTDIRLGDEVLGASLTPSYAQSAIADEGSLIAKPAAVPWEIAGSVAGAGGSAWAALDKIRLSAGETLLIHAAAGGVGTFATQLALARGVRVIGTASERNHDRLRSLGVEPVTYGHGLVERVRALAPAGVDAVLDASGRGEIPDSIELAGGPERVITLVAFDAADAGVQIRSGPLGADLVPALHEILTLVERRRLQVPVVRTFRLHEVGAAIDASRAGHVSGKIAILPDQ